MQISAHQKETQNIDLFSHSLTLFQIHRTSSQVKSQIQTKGMEQIQVLHRCSRRRRWDGHPIQLSHLVITKSTGDGNNGIQATLLFLLNGQSPHTLVSSPDYSLKLPRTPSLAPEKRYASSSITTSNDKSSESCGLTEVLHVSSGGFFVFLRSHFWILQWHKIPLNGEPNFGPFCWCNGGGGY
jgi:hypothetical protein